MSKKLYVGNLPFSLDDADLNRLFVQAGTVVSARVVLDSVTGRKKGFGFVEMSNEDEAKAAVSLLNGTEVEGRTIVVDIARERAPREGGFGRGGGDERRRRRDGNGGGFGGRR